MKEHRFELSVREGVGTVSHAFHNAEKEMYVCGKYLYSLLKNTPDNASPIVVTPCNPAEVVSVLKKFKNKRNNSGILTFKKEKQGVVQAMPWVRDHHHNDTRTEKVSIVTFRKSGSGIKNPVEFCNSVKEHSTQCSFTIEACTTIHLGCLL